MMATRRGIALGRGARAAGATMVAILTVALAACSGSGTAPTTVPAPEQAAPSALLTVSASPGSQTITTRTGGTAEYVLTLTSDGRGGAHPEVSVSSTPPLPPGVTLAVAPLTPAGPGSGATSTLTARVLAGAAAGRYELTIAAATRGATPQTTTATLVLDALENPIVTENQQRGTRAWQLGRQGFTTADDVAQQIKGYASSTSVAAGERLTFFVTVNPAQQFDLDVYRIGWYAGMGGRLMRHVPGLAGTSQPACPLRETTGQISCSWAASYTLDIPANWTSGAYLVMLTSASGYQNYVPFVVRDERPALFLFQASVNTYQAYNDYPSGGGGRSLYTTPPAVKVSFDRPYAVHGGSRFTSDDLPLVQWLEQSGYDVTYSTDLDTHANGKRLLGRAGFISGGHNEYWSKEMYDAAEAARDAGVNLAFLGANAVYWQVRMEPSADETPNRVMVCYKSLAADPDQSTLATTLWRDPAIGRPEQQLLGVQYSSQGEYTAKRAPYVVAASTSWVFAGTGLRDGSTIPEMVGYEVDRYFPDYPPPPASEHVLLSRSPFPDPDPADVAQSSLYHALSGAWVFATGTTEWTRGLDPIAGNTRVKRITSNVLNRFLGASPPAVAR